MAEKEKHQAAEAQPSDASRRNVSDAELRAAFEGPAFHSNKIYASNLGGGVRLTFSEMFGESVSPVYRTAVLLSYPDAISLRNLLNRQLKQIEEDIDQARQEAAEKAGGT